MADVKISGLPASTTPLAGTEVLPIVQGGTTKQVSIANVTAGRAIAATSITTNTYKAASSSGGALQNSGGTPQLQWGAGGGNNLSVDVAININPANAAVAISPTGTGTVTINPATASTMNNVAIGGTTPLAGTFTTATANSFIPNNATIPTNGLYLPATNAVALATNSTERARIHASGGVSIAGAVDPGASNLTLSGATTNFIGAINPTAAPSAGSSPSPRLSMSGAHWNTGIGSVAMTGYLQLNALVASSAAPTSKVSVFAGGNGATPTEVAFFGSDGNYSNKQASAASAAASQIVGNANAQGTATWRTVVRQVPVVSLGTQLIIPFVSQGSLNSTTIIRLTGTSAMFNNAATNYGFSAYINVGHLTSISAASWDLGGNIASVTTSGMNVIVTFTNAYTNATADGVFIALEYMCGTVSQSIDVANIVMN